MFFQRDDMTRDDRLRLNIAPSRHRGIEIGALNNPTVRPEEGHIEFIDYGTTNVLKAQHAHLPDRADGIVDVNHIWTGSGSLADIIGGRDLLDYAIASHVIEHVPNVLGWFRGIFETLKPGGVFNLAIPDRRYTFDANRQDSTLGEMVEADLLSYRTPSIRQMFDHCMLGAAIEPGSIWKENFDPASMPAYCGEYAVPLAYKQALLIMSENKYFDSHCWVFTPISFCKLIHGAASLGLFSFDLDEVTTTSPGKFEFFVHLRKPLQIKSCNEAIAQQIAAIEAVISRLQMHQQTMRLAAL